MANVTTAASAFMARGEQNLARLFCVHALLFFFQSGALHLCWA